MSLKQKPPSDAAINPSNAAMRQGPRPYNLHLFTTACLLSAAAWPFAQQDENREKIVGLVGDMTGAMMQGLKAYRTSPHGAKRRPHPSIWQDGSSRLLRVKLDAKPGDVPVLLVPSLINRFDILDLDAQHSFVSHLAREGFDPYILDWGAPTDREKTFTINDYILLRLYPALKQLKKPHVIGYCMGGTMAAGAIAALKNQSDFVRSLTLLAAPWDFHAGDQNMSLRMNAFGLTAEPIMSASGVLPVDWIQAMFASIDPLFAFNKFRQFAKMDPASDEARQFVIVEDWLNDGVDLPAPAARQALSEWYVDNQPHNGVWTLGSHVVDAKNIGVPVYVVAAGDDRLVPKNSALAIAQHIDAAESATPAIGHIGMMASRRAIQSVWEPLVAWLKTR